MVSFTMRMLRSRRVKSSTAQTLENIFVFCAVVQTAAEILYRFDLNQINISSDSLSCQFLSLRNVSNAKTKITMRFTRTISKKVNSNFQHCKN